MGTVTERLVCGFPTDTKIIFLAFGEGDFYRRIACDDWAIHFDILHESYIHTHRLRRQ